MEAASAAAVPKRAGEHVDEVPVARILDRCHRAPRTCSRRPCGQAVALGRELATAGENERWSESHARSARASVAAPEAPACSCGFAPRRSVGRGARRRRAAPGNGARRCRPRWPRRSPRRGAGPAA
jgi:hypothetical protein